MERNVSDSVKKRVAGRQRFTCAAGIPDYTCPQGGLPFDESGYEIDHITELRDGGTNDISNLQALCLMCHRVKTIRNTSEKAKKPVVQTCHWCLKKGATLFENEKWSCKDDCFKPCKEGCLGMCGSRHYPNKNVVQNYVEKLQQYRYKS